MNRFTVFLRDGTTHAIDAEFVHDDSDSEFIEFSVEDRPVAWVSRADVLLIHREAA